MSGVLATEETGAGDPVVFIHGWGLNLAVWDSTVSALAATHRCIAVDLPGHGHSAWDAGAVAFDRQLALLRDVLPDAPCTLAGWSLGGLFAMALAAREPARIGRLVLVATLPRFLASTDWPHGLSGELLDRFGVELATDYRRTVSDFLDLQTRGSANAAATRASLTTALRARGDATPEALGAGLDLLKQTDVRAELAAIQCPVLSIAGQYDRICAPAGMREMVRLIGPETALKVLTRAAHAPFVSHSQIFTAEMLEFLDDR